MNEWTSEIIRHGNCVVVIHRPVLNKNETADRERQIRSVMETTMRNYIARKEQIK